MSHPITVQSYSRLERKCLALQEECARHKRKIELLEIGRAADAAAFDALNQELQAERNRLHARARVESWGLHR